MSKQDSYTDLLATREQYARSRLDQLRNRIRSIEELSNFPDLTIFGAGSYARLEASEFSDIDMFFLDNAAPEDQAEPRTSRIRFFAKVISHVDQMHFPKFSNDGEYLKILHISDMLKSLGGPDDDYNNHFTTRMLLLLESKCLWKEAIYRRAIRTIVNSYFRDYPRHKNDFKPIFLINDIARYWKTLCLNYEHKRKQRNVEKAAITKQKVKNFKLKYSRMITCFATIAALSCRLKSVTIDDVCELVLMTPRERLGRIPRYLPRAQQTIDNIFQQYSWFLKMTALPTPDLERYFSHEENRRHAFNKANAFGDKMFELLQLADEKYKVMRYLVI